MKLHFLTAANGWKEDQNLRKRKHRHRKLIFFILLVSYLLAATLPYLHQPEVSEAFQKDFDPTCVYGDGPSCDRATVIDDNGEALEERIRLIEHAQERVILSTFEFRSDTSGKLMIAALLDAAGRGVQVDILLDGFNHIKNSKGNRYFHALVQNPNVTLRVYNPVNLLAPHKFMSRMHDKYVIADDSAYIIGGRNTYDFFLGDQDSYKNHDRDFLVCNTGGTESSIYELTAYFERIWQQPECRSWKPDGIFVNASRVQEAGEELAAQYRDFRSTHPECFDAPDALYKTFPVQKITLLSNPTGLYSKEPQLFYMLTQLMKHAKSEVLLHTPYIICNQKMYDALSDVTAGGVPVTIMTNAASNNGNPFGAVDHVLYKDETLATGVKILEYRGGISYHCKSMVIDHDLALVGSFNLDMKSAYQDTELMLVIHSEPVAEQLRENMEHYHEDATVGVAAQNKTEEIFEGNLPLLQKIERAVIRAADRWIRFLL